MKKNLEIKAKCADIRLVLEMIFSKAKTMKIYIEKEESITSSTQDFLKEQSEEITKHIDTLLNILEK